MIGKEQWQAIRERRAAGESVSAIARALDLDRKTVRSALERSTWSPYRRERCAARLLEAHQSWLVERAAQVHYSARVLFQELRSRGYLGSYETVKLAVRPLRAQASASALTQRRFETAPGEQAQVDWGQLSVALGGVLTKVHVFVMTLGYSRRAYAEGFLHERLPNLLSAHENAFAHFGGRCESILYDRMRTVVLGSVRDAADRQRLQWNETFLAFARHWGFAPRLCQPYRAQTKGKVESGVKYLKRNFAAGRAFGDLEDFNAQLARWQAEIADLREHGTTHERPLDRFAEEARAMAPTRAHPSFAQAIVRDRVVADDWLVAIEANRYSVPFALIGKTVQVVREGECWVIRHRGEIVASHRMLVGRAQLSVMPQHGPGATPRIARHPHHGAHCGQGCIDRTLDRGPQVEIRDLALYDTLMASGELA